MRKLTVEITDEGFLLEDGYVDVEYIDNVAYFVSQLDDDELPVFGSCMRRDALYQAFLFDGCGINDW